MDETDKPPPDAATSASAVPETEAAAETESEAEAEPESKPGTEPEAAPEAEPESGTESGTEATESATAGPEAANNDRPPAGQPAVPETGAAEPGEGESETEAAEPRPDDEIADLKDRLLRAMAETENVRKRALRDRDEASKYAVTGFARDLLGVADNLRRAIGSVPDEARGGDEALDNLLAGVDLTERELIAVLERHGVKPISPAGEKFDPNRHQAMFETPSAEAAPGTVVQVVQVGYTIADRLLRPAAVGVAAAPPAGEVTAPARPDAEGGDAPGETPPTLDTKV